MNRTTANSATRTPARVAGALLALMLAGAAIAQQGGPAQKPVEPSMQVPVQAQGVDVEERVGQTLPLDVTFTNSKGERVMLADYFKDGKPAIIAMVYYKCPIVCTVVLNRMAETINALDYEPGKDYRALVFSVDPSEDTKLAAATKLAHVSGYRREATPQVQEGWEFHTTDDAAARRLADGLGFRFRRLDTGAYSHPVALFIITPDGRISRYLYGFVYPARDVKLALLEASEGKLVRSIGDRMLNFCYMYDPKAGSYTLQAYRVMQIAGVLTVAALGTLIGGLFIGERLRRTRAARQTAPTDTTTSPIPTGGSSQ